jgi:hypothetical protein
LTKDDIPDAHDFRQPILDELNRRGGSAWWEGIIDDVADRLAISQADRTIMSSQKVKPKPVFVVRLRWASYYLGKEGKLSRNGGKWTALATKA